MPMSRNFKCRIILIYVFSPLPKLLVLSNYSLTQSLNYGKRNQYTEGTILRNFFGNVLHVGDCLTFL